MLALCTVLSTVASLRCHGKLTERSTAIVSLHVLFCSVPPEIDTP